MLGNNRLYLNRRSRRNRNTWCLFFLESMFFRSKYLLYLFDYFLYCLYRLMRYLLRLMNNFFLYGFFFSMISLTKAQSRGSDRQGPARAPL